MQTKSECDLHWVIYLAIGLLFMIDLWSILEKLKTLKLWQRTLFVNTVYIYVFLADSKHYVPIKLMSTTGNPRDFIVRGTLQKNHINITKHLIWDTFDINWSSAMLNLGKTETTSPNLVTVPLVDNIYGDYLPSFLYYAMYWSNLAGPS